MSANMRFSALQLSQLTVKGFPDFGFDSAVLKRLFSAWQACVTPVAVTVGVEGSFLSLSLPTGPFPLPDDLGVILMEGSGVRVESRCSLLLASPPDFFREPFKFLARKESQFCYGKKRQAVEKVCFHFGISSSGPSSASMSFRCFSVTATPAQICWSSHCKSE